MLNLLRKLLIIVASLSLLLGAFHLAVGQRAPRVRVYNPRIYQNTRQQMNDRAARRAALRKILKARTKGRSLHRRSNR